MKPNFLMKMLVSILGLSIFLIIGISFPIKMKAQGNEKQQVLVVYNNNQGKEAVINKSQEVDKQFKSVPAISVSLTQQAINELKQDPNVAYMEPNVRFKVSDNQLKPYKMRSNLETTSSGIPSERINPRILDNTTLILLLSQFFKVLVSFRYFTKRPCGLTRSLCGHDSPAEKPDVTTSASPNKAIIARLSM